MNSEQMRRAQAALVKIAIHSDVMASASLAMTELQLVLADAFAEGDRVPMRGHGKVCGVNVTWGGVPDDLRACGLEPGHAGPHDFSLCLCPKPNPFSRKVGNTGFERDRDRFISAWVAINKWRESVSGREATVRFVRRKGRAAERLGPHYTSIILRDWSESVNLEGVRVLVSRVKAHRAEQEWDALDLAAAWCQAQVGK